MQMLSVFKAISVVDSIAIHAFDINKGGAQSLNRYVSTMDVVGFWGCWFLAPCILYTFYGDSCWSGNFLLFQNTLNIDGSDEMMAMKHFSIVIGCSLNLSPLKNDVWMLLLLCSIQILSLQSKYGRKEKVWGAPFHACGSICECRWEVLMETIMYKRYYDMYRFTYAWGLRMPRIKCKQYGRAWGPSFLFFINE